MKIKNKIRIKKIKYTKLKFKLKLIKKVFILQKKN